MALAEKIGVSLRTVDDFERGRADPTPRLALIAEATGQPLGELLNEMAPNSVAAQAASVETNLTELSRRAQAVERERVGIEAARAELGEQRRSNRARASELDAQQQELARSAERQAALDRELSERRGALERREAAARDAEARLAAARGELAEERTRLETRARAHAEVEARRHAVEAAFVAREAALAEGE